MRLDELALRYGTDKSSRGHFYTRLYERFFGATRMEVESVCEVGVGSGESLRMWREYFPNALIYGVDLEHKCDMGERITLLESEQTNCEKLNENLHDKKLEIIIDDASHDQERTLKTLDCLWPILQTRGWYVIEDMDRESFPPEIGKWIGDRKDQVDQVYLLCNYSRTATIAFIQKQ